MNRITPTWRRWQTVRRRNGHWQTMRCANGWWFGKESIASPEQLCFFRPSRHGLSHCHGRTLPAASPGALADQSSAVPPLPSFVFTRAGRIPVFKSQTACQSAAPYNLSRRVQSPRHPHRNRLLKIFMSYTSAFEQYAALGVDTETALTAWESVPISLHCWQGDDVGGFEKADASLSGGGIQATGNHPGKARTISRLQHDLDKALSLIPGKHRLNLRITSFRPSPASRGISSFSSTAWAGQKWRPASSQAGRSTNSKIR